MQRRALTAVLASATVALSGALAASTVPVQAADPAASPLVVQAPPRVVARSYDGWVYSNLGVRMTAQGSNFEIQASREPSGDQRWWDRSYNSPITATWQQWDADGEPLPAVPLPDGAMTTWQGLEGFATVRIFRVSDGKRIRRISATGCFNGEATKVGPFGPKENPYPWSCPWNPYTLGSVMGVARDYSASLLPEWGTNLRLKPGTYRMVAGIAPQWREFFGIAEADATATSELVVKKARNRWRSASAPRRGTDDLAPSAGQPTGESGGRMPNQYAPDLRSLPAFDISLNAKGTAMRFGATVWNGGAGPMVIEGFRSDRSSDHMTAYQYYFDEFGRQTGFDEVGEFHYHAANHNHWHFQDFARYRLLKADADGNPSEEVAVRSTKASFCLVATDAVDLTVDNADMRPEYTDLGSQCGGRGALSLRQVLANGHGDTYHQFRAGQAFRIGSLPDGIYYISVEANPADANGRNLQESDDTNNDSLRKVRISTGKGGKRKVRVFQVGQIQEFSFRGFRAQMR